MDMGKLLEKFIEPISVKIAIVFGVLVILLVIAFSPSAGENIISVLLIVGTIAGTSKIPRKRRSAPAPQKKERSSCTKQQLSQDS
jgi:F0F1-type ATP synthase assembly protein I